MKLHLPLLTIAFLGLSFSLAHSQRKSGKQQYERYELTIRVSDLAKFLRNSLSQAPNDDKPLFFNTLNKPGTVLRSLVTRQINVEADPDKKKELQKIQKAVDDYLVDEPQKNRKGLVVLQHPFNRDVFYKQPDDVADDTELKTARGNVKKLETGLVESRQSYINNLVAISAAVKNNDNAKALQLIATNQALDALSRQIPAQLEAAQADANDKFDVVYFSKARYLEDSSKVDQTVAGGEGDENYFLDNKKILFVLIGNTKQLTDTKITLANLERLITGDIRDVGKLISALNISGGGGPMRFGKDLAKDDGTETVKFHFLVPTDAKIRPPYEIRIASAKLKDTIQVHELVKFRVKVAFGAGQADVSYFGLKNNQLVFNPDSARKSVLKSSLAAMLSYYPFGQDIDHLDGPFYKKPLQRMSIAGGLRISSDPLEVLFLGLNYDFQKNFGVFAGGAWYSSTITNVVPLNTPSNVVGYLRDSGKREYQGRFFFGLTMAPAAISELLGLKKK